MDWKWVVRTFIACIALAITIMAFAEGAIDRKIDSKFQILLAKIEAVDGKVQWIKETINQRRK